MYEDSVGIPMTLTGPGIKPSVNKTPVSLTDLASTIESFVTGKIPDEREAWRGRPIQSFFENPNADVQFSANIMMEAAHRVLYVEARALEVHILCRE